MTGAAAGTPAPVPDPDSVSVDQLKMVLEQLERLDDAEEERRKGADAKLTSTISIMPLVVALATSGLFPLVQNLEALGIWRNVIVSLYAVAVACFLSAIFWALRAIWPSRGTYKQSTIGTISKYRKPGTSLQGLLMDVINTQRECLKNNQKLNGRKLGEYMDSVVLTCCGLACVTIVVVCVVIGVLLGQVHPVRLQSGTSNTASVRVRTGPLQKMMTKKNALPPNAPPTH
jgi:hypothetical protein